MRSLYQRLLRLYPAVYRQEFGEEMQCVFLQAQAERSIAPLMKRKNSVLENSWACFQEPCRRSFVCFLALTIGFA